MSWTDNDLDSDVSSRAHVHVSVWLLQAHVHICIRAVFHFLDLRMVLRCSKNVLKTWKPTEYDSAQTALAAALRFDTCIVTGIHVAIGIVDEPTMIACDWQGQQQQQQQRQQQTRSATLMLGVQTLTGIVAY